MLGSKKIAVTGGLSCGKTSVCRIFEELGAQVVSSDVIVHRLLSSNIFLGQQVVALLGKDIITDGEIDRRKVADKVFNNPSLLQSLEKILHPAVMNEIEKEYQQVNNQHKTQLFIAEVPLLFEISGEDCFDYTIAVLADPDICKKRFKQSTGYDDKEYFRRMNLQLPPEEKAKRADCVIKNNNSIDDLRHSVADVFNELNFSKKLNN